MLHTQARFRKGAFAVTLLALGAVSITAAAQEEGTLRSPGAHRSYPIEIEPHVAVGIIPPYDGVGIGGRFSIPVLRNGFIPSINDSVAIGFGIDWLHTDTCYGDCGAEAFWVPVVMQWNFFLSNRWSVFAEPGIALAHSTHGGICPARDAAGNVAYVDCGKSLTSLEPVFLVGGRYHVTDGVAVTMCVGFPYVTLGASFM
jgi:hypothetical protein